MANWYRELQNRIEDHKDRYGQSIQETKWINEKI